MPFKNPDKRNAYNRTRRLSNLEKIRLIEQKSKRKNQWKYRERGRKYAAQWRKLNSEKYKETHRKWYEKIRNSRLPKTLKIPKVKVNDVFGFLTVIACADERKGHKRKWFCSCACGKETKTWESSLLKGAKSCGCKNNKANAYKSIIRERRRKAGVPEDFILTPVNIMERRIFSNRYRGKTIRRDGKKCLLCLDKSGGLHVHHIHPWSTHKELRFDYKNLITLCKNCHSDIAHGGDNLKEPNPLIANILSNLIENEYYSNDFHSPVPLHHQCIFLSSYP